MKFVVFALFAFLAAAVHTEDEYRYLWGKWREEHERVYENYEENYRYHVFKMNLDKVEKYMAISSDVVLQMNQFGDLSHEEFAARYLAAPFDRLSIGGTSFVPSTNDLPEQFDWLSKGAVTPVKDQGQCGSCYAFSAVGTMEGAWKVAGHDLTSFSEQQIVDCSNSYGNEGCNGGEMYASVQYVIDNGGIATEASYPYKAVQGKCLEKPLVGKFKAYYNVTKGSEDDLQNACATMAPVSVGIDASSWEFQFYYSGVYDPSSCSTTDLDHGVTLTGYNADPKLAKQYWIIKNSWGTGWGQKGYFWMRKGINRCGVATQAVVAEAM